MIVGVCGFGCTGSSAILDYLREYDNISLNEMVELSFLYDPDGVLDLENAICKTPIRYYSPDAAIKKFHRYMMTYDIRKYMARTMNEKEYVKIVEDYVNDITKTKWHGYWHFDKRQLPFYQYMFKYVLGYKYMRVFDKLGCPIPKSYPNNAIMRVPVDTATFMDRTRRFLRDMVVGMGIDVNFDNSIMVFDQPFPANKPQLVYDLFWDNCKSIIVNRDPRDLYTFVKKFVRLEACWIPYQDCQSFIEFYKHQMSICDFDDSVLMVNFEDLIYDFDNTAAKICQFLGIEKQTHEVRYFKPEVSIGNTQLYKRYNEFADDIKMIEQQLPSYLYNFERYGEITIKEKPFLYTV